MISDKTWLSDAESTLTEVANAILQTNKRMSSKMLDLLIAKGVGAAGVTGVASIVGVLGTASTGTAIGTLSGAAATSAKLFWVGSLVGGGVTMGTGILAVGGIAAGFGAIRYWRGKPRSLDALNEQEKAILKAVEFFVVSFRSEVEKKSNPTEEELEVIRLVWTDLSDSIDQYRRLGAPDVLSPKYRLRLKRANSRMRDLTKGIRA
jgi:hypothetical protein